MRITAVEISFVFLVSACSAPVPGEAVHRQAATVDGGTGTCPVDAAPACIPFADDVRVAEVCPGTRWIVHLPDQKESCPTIDTPTGAWRGTSLFQNVGPRPSGALPSELTSFCAYDWEGAQGYEKTPNLDALDVPLLADRSRDCHMLMPMGSMADELSWEALNAHFHEQVGYLSPLPLDESLPPRPVRVAVVDSVPDNDPPAGGGSGVSPHGHAVQRVIAEIGCPPEETMSSACITWPSPHLALTIDEQRQPAMDTGGYYGRISDLAVAVVDAVEEWRHHKENVAESDPEYQRRLVVNLSVAWDARWGGYQQDVEAMPVPVRAVHAALTHLKCQGGLAIAAAGNDPGGPEESSGPMLPALWETRPAPDLAECEAFEEMIYDSGLEAEVFPRAGTYDPLVHAVGGVRADNRFIAVSRPDSRPSLVAHAMHVVAADVDALGNSVPTAVLTGSSMAAAVTSAVAATAWGYAPNLTGARLMEYVHGAGEHIGTTADFALDSASRAVRRVMLCKAVEEICVRGGIHCPASVPTCPTPRPTTRFTPSADVLTALRVEALQDNPNSPLSARGSREPLPAVAQCQHDGFYGTDPAAYPPNVCPYRQWGQTVRKPVSGAQPGLYPCTTCSLELSSTQTNDLEATLYVSIDLDYPHSVRGGTVEIEGYGEIDVSVMGELSPGDEAVVENIPILSPDPDTPLGLFDTAVINFRNVDANGVALDSATTSELTLSQ